MKKHHPKDPMSNIKIVAGANSPNLDTVFFFLLSACSKNPHPKTLPETNPDSVTMRTLQPPLSWQLYMHLSSADSEAASNVDTVSVVSSFPETYRYAEKGEG